VVFVLNCVTQCNVLSKDSHLSCDSFLTLLHYVLCTFMVYHPPFLVDCRQYWYERQNFILFLRFLAWCSNFFSGCIAVHSINMLHIVWLLCNWGWGRPHLPPVLICLWYAHNSSCSWCILLFWRKFLFHIKHPLREFKEDHFHCRHYRQSWTTHSSQRCMLCSH